MILKKVKAYVIMDKGRTVIAKGIPRNRWLVKVNDEADQQRILTYTTEGRAKAGFTGCGFWGNCNIVKEVHNIMCIPSFQYAYL